MGTPIGVVGWLRVLPIWTLLALVNCVLADDPFFIMLPSYPNRLDFATYGPMLAGGPIDPGSSANLSWAQDGLDRQCDDRMETRSLWTFDNKNVVVLEDIQSIQGVSCSAGEQGLNMQITVNNAAAYLYMYAQWNTLTQLTFITTPNSNYNQGFCNPVGANNPGTANEQQVERNCHEVLTGGSPSPLMIAFEPDPTTVVTGDSGPFYINVVADRNPTSLVDTASNVRLVMAPNRPNQAPYVPTGTATENTLTVTAPFSATGTGTPTGTPGGVGSTCSSDSDCRSPIKCVNAVCGGCSAQNDCSWGSFNCVNSVCGGCNQGVSSCDPGLTCSSTSGLCGGGTGGGPDCRPNHCLGDTCTADVDCDENLTCQSGTCRLPGGGGGSGGGVGSPCGTASNAVACNAGLYCVSSACSQTPGNPGDICTGSLDCKSGESCPANSLVCTSGGGSEGTPCDPNNPCVNTLSCVGGTCSEPGGGPGDTCGGENSCVEGLTCQSNVCAPGGGNEGGGEGGEGDQCSAESHCQEGLSCVNNQCSETGGNPGDTCVATSDCKSGLECSEAKKCEPQSSGGGEGSPCGSLSSCNPGLYCVNSLCSTTPGGENSTCLKDTDCEAPLTCTQGKCSEGGGGGGGGDGSPCESNNDCNSPLTCIEGKCSQDGGGGGGGGDQGSPCQYNQDCKSPYICKDGTCTTGEGGQGGGPGDQCSSIYDCNSGLSCVRGTCKSNEGGGGGGGGGGEQGSTCRKNSECSYGLDCIKGVCSGRNGSGGGSSGNNGGQQGQACQGDSDCSYGLSCSYGACISTGGEGDLCGKKNDCQKGYICKNSACTSSANSSGRSGGQSRSKGKNGGSNGHNASHGRYPAESTAETSACTSSNYSPYPHENSRRYSSMPNSPAVPTGRPGKGGSHAPYTGQRYKTYTDKPSTLHNIEPIVTPPPGQYLDEHPPAKPDNFQKCRTKTTSTVSFRCGKVTTTWTQAVCVTALPGGKTSKGSTSTSSASSRAHHRRHLHAHHKRHRDLLSSHKKRLADKTSVNEAHEMRLFLRGFSIPGTHISVPSASDVVNSASSVGQSLVNGGSSLVVSTLIPSASSVASSIASVIESALSFSTSASANNPLSVSTSIPLASQPEFTANLDFNIQGTVGTSAVFDIDLVQFKVKQAQFDINGNLQGGINFDVNINGDVNLILPVKCALPILFAPYNVPGVFSLGPYWQFCMKLNVGAHATNYQTSLGFDFKSTPDTFLDVVSTGNSHASGWKPDTTFHYPDQSSGVQWDFTPLWTQNIGITCLFGQKQLQILNITAGVSVGVGVGFTFEETDDPYATPLNDCAPPSNIVAEGNLIVDIYAFAGVKALGNNIPIPSLYTTFNLYSTAVYFNPNCGCYPNLLPPATTVVDTTSLGNPNSFGVIDWGTYPPVQTLTALNPNPTGSGNIVLGLDNPSPDGTCGGVNRYTCPQGQCCSPEGWCGESSVHCNDGCQPFYGTCAGTCPPAPPGK